MEESFERKLLEVDLLDIYDDIAEIDISPDNLITVCSAFNCRVNLKKGNVVYAIEKKYKNKLLKYNQEKRLKWLKLNLKAIMPNPEQKLLKWQQNHSRNERLSWLKRKMDAIDYFTNESRVCFSEEPCCSHSVVIASERRLSQNFQQTAGLSRVAFQNDLTNDNSVCTSTDNTSMESVQTVIASEPKNTQDSSDNANDSILADLNNVSRSILSMSSAELPSLCSQDANTPSTNEAQTKQNISINQRVKPPEQLKTISQLVDESEGLLSQDAYITFYQDTKVTSTQEMRLL